MRGQYSRGACAEYLIILHVRRDVQININYVTHRIYIDVYIYWGRDTARIVGKHHTLRVAMCQWRSCLIYVFSLGDKFPFDTYILVCDGAVDRLTHGVSWKLCGNERISDHSSPISMLAYQRDACIWELYTVFTGTGCPIRLWVYIYT